MLPVWLRPSDPFPMFLLNNPSWKPMPADRPSRVESGLGVLYIHQHIKWQQLDWVRGGNAWLPDCSTFHFWGVREPTRSGDSSITVLTSSVSPEFMASSHLRQIWWAISFPLKVAILGSEIGSDFLPHCQAASLSLLWLLPLIGIPGH